MAPYKLIQDVPHSRSPGAGEHRKPGSWTSWTSASTSKSKQLAADSCRIAGVPATTSKLAVSQRQFEIEGSRLGCRAEINDRKSSTDINVTQGDGSVACNVYDRTLSVEPTASACGLPQVAPGCQVTTAYSVLIVYARVAFSAEPDLLPPTSSSSPPPPIFHSFTRYAMPAAWDIYSKQLLPLKRGHPLWCPEPSHDFGEVRLGDVGYLSRGRFYVLFNTMHDENDPVNHKRGVPPGFKQFVPPPSTTSYDPHDITQSCLHSGSLRSISMSVSGYTGRYGYSYKSVCL